MLARLDGGGVSVRIAALGGGGGCGRQAKKQRDDKLTGCAASMLSEA
jgi:hypothetical protein